MRTEVSDNLAADDDDDLSSSTESDLSQQTAEQENITSDTAPTNNVSLDTDISNVMLLQSKLQSLQRVIDRERRIRVSLNNKRQSLEAQINQLTRKLESLSKDKFSLETARIDLETKLRSVQCNLEVEMERRTNLEMIVARTKDQLARSESLCQREADSRLKLEIQLKQLQTQLQEKTEQLSQLEIVKEENTVNDATDVEAAVKLDESGALCKNAAISCSTADDNDFDDDDKEEDNYWSRSRHSIVSNTNQQLTVQLYTLKAELEHQMLTHKDIEQTLLTENEALQQQIVKLRQDLEVDAVTLAETTTQYNVEISELKARNIQLNNDITAQHHLQTQISTLQTQLDSTITEFRAAQNRCEQLEKQLKHERDETKREVDQLTQQLNKVKEDRYSQEERLRTAQQKLTQVDSELKVYEVSHNEKCKQLTDVTNELSSQRKDCNTLRDKLRQQQEENATLRAKIDSLQDRVSFLQGEAESLKQSADNAHCKAENQSEQLLVVMATLKNEHSKVQSELEERNLILERRMEELLDRAINSEAERDLIQRELTDTQTALKNLNTSALQSHGDLELDNERLQTQLDSLQRQLDTESRDHDVNTVQCKQLSDRLAEAEQNMDWYKNALRAREADLAKAMRYMIDNNSKLSQVIDSTTSLPNNQLPMLGKQPLTMETTGIDVEQAVNSTDETNASPGQYSKQSQKKTAKAQRLQDHMAMEQQISSLKMQLRAYKKHLHGHRPHGANQSGDGLQLRRHAHQLMAELQQLRNVQKQQSTNNHQKNDKTGVMLMAELEARVRMQLNDKLSSINKFLHQHADHCDQIDRARHDNQQHIRTQLQRAEQELRETMMKMGQEHPDLGSEGQTEGQECEVSTHNTRNLETVNELEELKHGNEEPSNGDHPQSSEHDKEVNDIKDTSTINHRLVRRDDLMQTTRNDSLIKSHELTLSGSKFGSDNLSVPVPEATKQNSELPFWLQQELDRSIHKHLEKLPQLQLVAPQYTTTRGTSLTTSANVLGSSSRDYMSALEKYYFIA